MEGVLQGEAGDFAEVAGSLQDHRLKVIRSIECSGMDSSFRLRTVWVRQNT